MCGVARRGNGCGCPLQPRTHRPHRILDRCARALFTAAGAASIVEAYGAILLGFLIQVRPRLLQPYLSRGVRMGSQTRGPCYDAAATTWKRRTSHARAHACLLPRPRPPAAGQRRGVRAGGRPAARWQPGRGGGRGGALPALLRDRRCVVCTPGGHAAPPAVLHAPLPVPVSCSPPLLCPQALRSSNAAPPMLSPHLPASPPATQAP